jgi:purine-binding chemotaxis protein CheW
VAERMEPESADIGSGSFPHGGRLPSEPAPVVSGTRRWVVFSVDAGRYALALDAVERIVRAVQVTQLPAALPVLMGVIDVQGRVLPVLSLRRRFGLPERLIDPKDHFLIARSAGRTVVLPIDGAEGVLESSEAAEINSASIAPQLEYVRGVIRLSDGLVVIHDLDAFLSAEEQSALAEAMRQDAARGNRPRVVERERRGASRD